MGPSWFASFHIVLNRRGIQLQQNHWKGAHKSLPAPAVDFLLGAIDEWSSDAQEPLEPEQLVGYGQPPVVGVEEEEEATPEDDGKSNQQPP